MLKNKRTTWCHLLLFFTSYVLNVFRTLIYPSSGACDCVVELPHLSFCSHFVVCWRFGAAGFEWCPCCRLKHNKVVLQPAAPNLQHTTNWEQNDRCGNSTTQSQAPDDGYINVRNTFNTFFHSPTIKMMHGPINIRLTNMPSWHWQRQTTVYLKQKK